MSIRPHVGYWRSNGLFAPLQCLKFLAATDHAPPATFSGVSNGPTSTIAVFLQMSIAAARYYRPGHVESHTHHVPDDSRGIACTGSHTVLALHHSYRFIISNERKTLPGGHDHPVVPPNGGPIVHGPFTLCNGRIRLCYSSRSSAHYHEHRVAG